MEAPVQATHADLTKRCGHECLSQPDHDGPHFYGYRLGPHSYEGLLARVDELERALLAIASIPDNGRWAAHALTPQEVAQDAIGLDCADALNQLLADAGWSPANEGKG
jgi:hypothetical protein